jgi:methionyl-tRNA synthetase
MRRILVTSALPYANGPLHFGHVLEAVQTDIWARSMRMAGHECLYVCADDTHGTPIMLKAQAEGMTPEQLIAGIEAEHRATYQGFLIDHAFFHSTHSDENRHCTETIFKALDAAGYISRRSIRQAYDESAQMFLPDRYVKGTCPRCEAADQYGDSCEVCGATYSPSDLKNPVSVLSGTPPVERESEHLFFRLDAFEAMLREWTRSGAIHESVANKLEEWFSAGLRDWDISRDAPYFGFEIPGHPGKYFYVWLDAPVGYMAASLALAQRDGLDFEGWWASDSTAELHHFIGKDILYFHTLFWPAVLQGAGYRRPTQVHAHGFLTVNGQKMSKSRGTFITGQRYLERLPPEPLRYYFAAKLGPGIDDMDLSLDDFVSRFNSDVVGKLVNIASRCAGFVARGGGRLATALPDPALYAEFADACPRIAALYESRDFIAAIREIASLADRANQYIDTQKPWNLAKDPARAEEVLAVCTQGINLFRVLMTYLAPVLPAMAIKAGRFLGHPVTRWDDVAAPLLGSELAVYEPLATRLDPKVVATLIDDTHAAPTVTAAPPPQKPAPAPAAAPSATTAAASTPTSAPVSSKGEITIDDFAKLDLRVGKVLECSLVDGSDKLLRLQIDLGNGDVRQIFSGIRESYAPETMVGRHVVVIANLKPRKMRFGLSQGMVLCASDDNPGVYLVSPDDGGAPGMTVT